MKKTAPDPDVWNAERVAEIYRTLHRLVPTLPSLTDRLVPSAEFNRHLFGIQNRRQAADRAAIQINEKLGEQKRIVETAKQNLRLAEVFAQEVPSVVGARSIAERKRLIDQLVHPERTALAKATGTKMMLESLRDAIKSTVDSLENARITVNSAINLSIAEMKVSRSNH